MSSPQPMTYLHQKNFLENIYNNMIYDTNGIDIRFAPSTAFIKNNIYNGIIRDSRCFICWKESSNFRSRSFQHLSTLLLLVSVSAAGKDAAKDVGENINDLTKDYCQNNRIAPSTRYLLT